MARVESSVFINRPIADVFSFVSDIGNNKKWQAGIVESVRVGEGPVGVGSAFKDVREFLGQRIESMGEITEYEPNRVLGFKVTTGPVPFAGRTAFEVVEGGTRITFQGEGEPGGVFKLLEPIVIRTFQKQIEDNFARLKALLETR